MHESTPNNEDLLLDLHLNRIDDQDRAQIEAALERDEQLCAKSDRLRQALRPLDYWSCNQAPTRLVDRILAVTRGGPDRAAVHPVDASPQRGRTFRIPLREILAVAACLGLLASVAIPGLSHVRDRARRTQCAGNLGSVFQGVKLYQTSFGGSLPFAGKRPGTSWLPVSDSNAPFASNSRHIYLIAKHNFGPKPADFVCPAGGEGKPMRSDELADRDDFADRGSNNYDSLNLSGPSPNLHPRTAIAYLSDANPLFRDGRFDDTVDPVHTNSPSHGGAGQTVLTLDGSAAWMDSPIYGSARDNVWLAGDIRRYTGIEAPASEDDAHLVPGYPTTDSLVRALLQN